MYICNNCDEVFDEPVDTYCEETYYSHGLKTVEIGGLACPFCESGDFQESIDCVFCGNESKEGVCEKCLQKQANLENALLINKEINDIEITITNENAQEYCLEDTNWFVDWLVEKEKSK